MKLPEDWKRGDVLRVIEVDPADPCKLGDIVVHVDNPGDSVPYCLTPSGKQLAFVAERQLEFVSRPEES